MGIFSDYLNSLKDYKSIAIERKKQLRRISELRGHAVLTIASDMGGMSGKVNAPIGIDYNDLLPVADQLDTLEGDKIDVILETPGGQAERAEDIVRLLRNRFSYVCFIVPGAAMSAGTIMVMSGNEILLEPISSLGPIDAQIVVGGKRFSAEAFLEGMNEIKAEVEKTGNLNRAYIPILQGITPADIQACKNLQSFSAKLVSEWLFKWKFQTWETHSTNGQPVTEEVKHKRAEEIAKQLCNHSHWLTHSRSIKLEDLVNMGLKVVNYSEIPDLHDAVRRYYTLLRMGFDSTSMYKLFETPDTQIARHAVPVSNLKGQKTGFDEIAEIQVTCPNCNHRATIQANIGKTSPLKPGNRPFPDDNLFKCPNCGEDTDISDIRNDIEAQSGKLIVPERS